MGRRAGFDISLDDFDRIGRDVPVIANIRPNGDTYLMEDFYYAGGLPVVLRDLAEGGLLNTEALTVTGSLESDLVNQIDYTNSDEVVSTDFVGNRFAGIIDAQIPTPEFA